MPRTPNRDSGPGQEEELQFIEDLGSLVGPYSVGRVGTVLRGKDPTYGEFDLGGGAGLTVALHLTLDQLVHQLSENQYVEYTYVGNKISGIIVWTSAAKIVKIREWQYTYSGNRITDEVVIQYDGVGTEVERLTTAYTYTGNKITSYTVDRTTP